ncbi:hypothetical protein NKH18_45310 [Streptomyces sp. M10(2022)]
MTAAGLMVQVPAGVDQPVSAGREVRHGSPPCCTIRRWQRHC